MALKNGLPLVGFLIALVFLVCAFGAQHMSTSAAVHETLPILIDPGHGGEDGGAVAQDGTLEKNINLSISLSLRDMLQVWGYPVKMTRQTDRSVYDSGSSVREKKVSDMRNRLAMYEQASLVISIHQNHFSQAKYKGAQVFFSGNASSSEHLAAAVQKRLIQHVQPENNRQIKKATDGIYLLYHTHTPAVLVECGFLSNPEECANLLSAEYQQRIAGGIFAGFLDATIEDFGNGG